MIYIPVISRFYGITIRMYFQQCEHNPPHIHAIYGEDVVTIDFRNNEILEGNFPPKALDLVFEWIKIHQNELENMWYTQEFKNINPLK